MARLCAKGLHDLDVVGMTNRHCKACKSIARAAYQRARKLKRVAKGEAKMSKEARRALLTNRINAIRDRLERETRRWLAIPIEAELAAAVAEMRALDEVPA